MSSPPRDDEAQRELEQRALRNVRGLVDKMEGIDKVDKKRERRLLGAIIAIAVVGGIIVVGSVMYMSSKQQNRGIVIDPAKSGVPKGGSK